MAKAIKVNEAFFNGAKKALEQAKITHSWDKHKNVRETFCLIVRNKDALKALSVIGVNKILNIHNRRHWEQICLNNGYWESN